MDRGDGSYESGNDENVKEDGGFSLGESIGALREALSCSAGKRHESLNPLFSLIFSSLTSFSLNPPVFLSFLFSFSRRFFSLSYHMECGRESSKALGFFNTKLYGFLK
jgi:hypothetical protein